MQGTGCTFEFLSSKWSKCFIKSLYTLLNRDVYSLTKTKHLKRSKVCANISNLQAVNKDSVDKFWHHKNCYQNVFLVQEKRIFGIF